MSLGFLSAAKMVHKKVASKLGIPADQAKFKAKEEKEESSKQPGAAQGKAGEVQKMKLKKSRSIKLSHSDSFKLRKQQLRWRNITGGGSSNSSKKKGTQARASEGSPPNYMKSTSSSKAKKEVVQVSPKSPTTSKCKSPNDIMQSKHGSMLPSNKSPNNMMKRNSSLKPVRSLMKKNSTKALYPKVNVGRATCSSTLKDTKFPASLDVHPSEVEVESTSVMKVCPYNYCSLNGHHHHESLPSLKRFVSIRRRMLRAQKSMKLKGLSATEINHIGQDEKEIGIGQMNVTSSNAKVYPFLDDDTDFFVEIYVKPMNETTKKNPESREEHDEIELNLSEASDTEKEDCAATESKDGLEENFGLESKIDQITSTGEVTKNATPLSLYECNEKDKEEEAANSNQTPKTKPEMKVDLNYCIGKDEQLKLQISESQNENPTQDELFSNSADIDEQHSCADGCGNCKDDRDNRTVAEQQSLEINHSTKALKKQDEDLGALDIHGVSNPVSQDNHNSEAASKFDVDGKEFILHEDSKDKDMKSAQPEALERASDQTADNIKQMEATDVSKLSEKLVTSENNQALTNEDMFSGSVTNQKNRSSRGTQTDAVQEEVIEEEELKKMVVPSKELVIQFEQEAHQLSPKTQHTKEVFQRTARKIVVRDESPLKGFNPRGPNFLSLEPNAETEKVDLKHQLMDERRSPEEWMLDHALQQAVGKLISGGRSRRVNLLVKAFETIIPECETPLQNVTSSFPQARPIQACR